MIICCQEEILKALETKKNSDYLNVSAFEKGFNEDYYDTGASNKYVLDPVFDVVIPYSTKGLVKYHDYLLPRRNSRGIRN
jgi:hypothetical protein